jgi:hypothetical protein
MAKGGGGEGHFDERRRAAKPKAAATGYADSPEVLAALVKPRAKPTVVVKKKKVIAPPPAKAATPAPALGADWGRPGFIEAELRSQRPLSRKRDRGPFDDQIVTSSLKSSRVPTATFGGSGRSLLDWVKNRTAMQKLDT